MGQWSTFNFLFSLSTIARIFLRGIDFRDGGGFFSKGAEKCRIRLIRRTPPPYPNKQEQDFWQISPMPTWLKAWCTSGQVSGQKARCMGSRRPGEKPAAEQNKPPWLLSSKVCYESYQSGRGPVRYQQDLPAEGYPSEYMPRRLGRWPVINSERSPRCPIWKMFSGC